MSLHDRIMKEVDAFPFNTMSTHVNRDHLETYVEGFNRAKDQAAQIAKEADELMAEMATELEISCECKYGDCTICRVLNKYNAWKEQTK